MCRPITFYKIFASAENFLEWKLAFCLSKLLLKKRFNSGRCSYVMSSDKMFENWQSIQFLLKMENAICDLIMRAEKINSHSRLTRADNITEAIFFNVAYQLR